ncbi:hypothetical protein SHDE107825_19270 [Shewanella denitrificans]|jgi:hypothetical protein
MLIKLLEVKRVVWRKTERAITEKDPSQPQAIEINFTD